MASGGVDRLGMPCRRAIALAVIGGAEMRSALQHLAPDRHVRRGRIAAVALAAAARIGRYAAGIAALLFINRRKRPPVRGPLPDIADHVEQSKTIGRVSA